jgi:SAM-dependent methyltransferase
MNSRQLKRTINKLRASLRGVTQLSSAFKVPVRLRNSPRYLLYLGIQLEKSKRYASKTGGRSAHLIKKLLNALQNQTREERATTAILCIGCRNTHELDLFLDAGFGQVTGIDLFSSEPRIQVMDMHDLQFPDNQFDIVYSCHSLEHSFDPVKAAREFIRIAKPGGICVIEVPIKFETSPTDLQDFNSVDGVRRLFEPHVGDMLFAEKAQDSSEEEVARMAFRVTKNKGAGNNGKA